MTIPRIKLIKRKRLVKKAGAETPEPRAETGFAVDPNRWSRAVRAWVSEFQEKAQSERPPAFDRLFQSTEQSRS